MKGSKKYFSYEYAHMPSELLQPGKAGKSINVIDKKAGKKLKKSKAIRSTKIEHDYE